MFNRKRDRLIETIIPGIKRHSEFSAIKDLDQDTTITINPSSHKRGITNVAVIEYDEGDTANTGKFINEKEESSQNNYKVFEEGKRSEKTLLDKTHNFFNYK